VIERDNVHTAASSEIKNGITSKELIATAGKRIVDLGVNIDT
jgi:hypothetical protein